MSSVVAALAALVLVSFHITSDAAAFLDSKSPRTAGVIAQSDVEEAFRASFSDLANSPKLRMIEDELRSLVVALPKNDRGYLAPPTVRYAVHRYFAQKYGWYMKGLDPSSTWNSTSGSTMVTKDKVPAMIQKLFDEHLHGHGVGLHEVAVFAAALSQLVEQEVASDLQKIFMSLELPTKGDVHMTIIERAVRAFFVFYLYEVDMQYVSPSALRALESDISSIYPAWNDTSMWLEDYRRAHDVNQISRRNPFKSHDYDTFENSVAYMQELGHKFGSFQKLECAVLKEQLVQMEHQGTGRVRLSRFYSGSLDGDWTFAESVDFLRNVGALDESDPSKVSVLIPNYITSQTNCLTGSGFYSVCCSNECEDLIRSLERSVGAPTAKPEQLLKLVAAMSSDTVDAPRNLSSSLHSRLEDIAALHRGEVPIHGRLFAQWMHHAYPRECPYPHVAGTVNPKSPDEWMAANGKRSVEASVDEMRSHFSLLEKESEEAIDMPWSDVEELVAEYGGSDTTWACTGRSIMAAAAVLSFLVPLVRAVYVAANNARPRHVMDKNLV